MKKNSINDKRKRHGFWIPVLLIFLFLPSISNGAEKKIFIDLSLNDFFPSGTEFKSIYASSILIPQINAGYFLSGEFYIFGGFEFYKAEGKTPDWDFALEMAQNIFSLGGGYFKKLSEKLGISGQLGLVYISYTEKLTAAGLENKGNCTGFRLSTKLQYKLNNSIGLFIKLGYTAIKDTFEDLTINFGGFTAGIGMMLSF